MIEVEPMEASHKPTRRQFGQALLGSAAAPLAMPTVAEQAQAQADPNTIAVNALYELIRSRYSKFLPGPQLESVKRSIIRNQQIAELLKQVKLQNIDEPSFAFRADLP